MRWTSALALNNSAALAMFAIGLTLLTATGCPGTQCMSGKAASCPCPQSQLGPGPGQAETMEVCADADEPNPCSHYTLVTKACAFAAKSTTYNLSSPELQYATIDGVIDNGTSELKVQIPAEDDAFTTKLQGRVALIGGCFPGQKCPLQLLLAQLSPVAPVLYTQKNHKISEVTVANLDSWNGLKQTDESLVFAPSSELVIAARTDDQPRLAVLRPASNIQGRIYWGTYRQKGDGLGAAQNSLLRIWGDFETTYALAHLEISIWLTSCQPMLTPKLDCSAVIDPFTPATLSLGTDAKLLGSFEAGLDLCEATLAPSSAQVCTAGISDEFPTFHCATPSLPPPDSPEYNKLFTFRWEDSAGIVLGEKRDVTLETLPLFPVRLTVTNRWGRTVSATVPSPPVCASKVPVAGLPTFGTILADGRKASGSTNWSSRLDPKNQRYEISISAQDYYIGGHTTLLTPSFGSSVSGTCITDSVEGKLLVQCRSWDGTPVTPASVAFVSFRNPGTEPIAKGPVAYGVISQGGSRLSGSYNWSSLMDAVNQQFEISISGVDYHHLAFATLLTPGFRTGESGTCKSDSVNGKLLVSCTDSSGKRVMPAFVSFIIFQSGRTSAVKAPTAFGVVAGTGHKLAGTSNWNSELNPTDGNYQVRIDGENYHFRNYATVVAPSFGTGMSGFCTSNSVNDKLIIQCYDHGGQPTQPASLGFLAYRIP